MTYKIGLLIGSLSSTSINRRLANALVRLAPDDLEITEIPIKDLPLYSQDYDADYPAAGRELKAAIEASDGILIVTPEFNRSIPGGLKNAIDWASRPWGTNSLALKPSAVAGASIGNISTALAQQALRSVLSFLNSPELASPEAYIHFTEGLIDEDGTVNDPGTEEFLRGWIKSFSVFVSRVATAVDDGRAAER